MESGGLRRRSTLADRRCPETPPDVKHGSKSQKHTLISRQRGTNHAPLAELLLRGFFFFSLVATTEQHHDNNNQYALGGMPGAGTGWQSQPFAASAGRDVCRLGGPVRGARGAVAAGGQERLLAQQRRGDARRSGRLLAGKLVCPSSYAQALFGAVDAYVSPSISAHAVDSVFAS